MNKRPTREEAENAVRTLIAWAGDNPERKELIETPKRVVNAYEELFIGYKQTITQEVGKSFENNNDYDDMIIVREIIFESHCEHHMVPIIGKAHVAYIPDQKILGLSKIARIVDILSKRLQIQERLTLEIAKSIDEIVKPKGVGVVIESSHQCLTMRGAYKPGSLMRTLHMVGCFKEDNIRKDFLSQITDM